MRKLTTLILALGLVFGASLSAQSATEFSVNGFSDVTVEYANGSNLDDAKSNDPFKAASESSVTFGMKSENVKGALVLKVSGNWGNSAKGFSLGTDGINFATQQAWIDFKIPSTPVNVRLGLQSLSLPNSLPNIGNVVFNSARVAAVSFSAPINDTFALTGFWARPIDVDVNSSGTTTKRYDEFDLFALTAPIKYSNYFNVTPWLMFGQLGKDTLPLASNVAQNSYRRGVAGMTPHYTNLPVNTLGNTTKQATPFWFGMPFSSQYFDPFSIYFDASYGDNGFNNSASRSGWFTTAMLSYKFSNFTPSITAWYGSGDDSNPANGSEILPYLAGPQPYTQFGFGSQPISNATNGVLSSKAVGSWGVRLQVADISFTPKLKHLVRVAYYQGTNSKSWSNVQAVGKSPIAIQNNYLTTKDSAFEFSVQNTYKIYDQLSLKFDFSMIMPNFSKSTWNPYNDPARDFKTKNVYSIIAGVSYLF